MSAPVWNWARTKTTSGDPESFYIPENLIDSSTAWGEGVRAIQSVLDPGSATAEALSPEQRQGLRKVQMLLLRHGAGGGESHVPKELLCDENEQDENCKFLLSHYGGVTKTVCSKNKLRNVVVAHSFVHGLIKTSLTSKLRPDTYAPVEWDQLSRDSRKRLREILSWSSLSRWDFDVFELAKLCGGHPLLFLGWAILGSPQSQQAMAQSCEEEVNRLGLVGYGFENQFSLSQRKLCAFLRAVEGDYRKENETPYHNNMHAADVLQTLHSILQMNGQHFASGEIEIFAVLIAAAVHDVGHPGYNNSFQVNANTDLALLYNDISVLENMHASKAFRRLLGTEKEPEMNLLSGLMPEQLASVRKMVIEVVLCTDMAKHFATMDKMKGLLASSNEDEIKKKSSMEVLSYMLHLADISNPAKPAPVFVEWADRCLAEFFAQGDMEAEMGLPISPLCDRAKTSRAGSQIGFITYVVKPAFELLAKLLPSMDETVMPIIAQNLEYWKHAPENGSG